MKNKVDIYCESCNGTGLYVGMTERNGFSVVCAKCQGTGCVTMEYEAFEGKRPTKKKITRVLRANPGIMVGVDRDGPKEEDFGGVSIKEFEEKGLKAFVPGTEMRKFTCPAWWYQSADYSKKPDWDECLQILGKTFSQCECFSSKKKCWERFDKEHKK